MGKQKSLIVAGRFSTFGKAEQVAQKLFSRGFTRQNVSVFFVTPPGQHAQYPIGGDRYADPDAQLAARGAAYWMSGGAAIGALIGMIVYLTLWRNWFIPVVSIPVGIYIGSLMGALKRTRGPAVRNTHDIRDTGVMLAAHVMRENALEVIRILEESGAADVERATGVWQDGQWKDFDPRVAPRAHF